MSTVATGRASGKLILLGEHAVVYGYPAIAVGLSLGTEVQLHRRPGPTTCSITNPDPSLTRALAQALPNTGLHVQIQSELPIGRGMGSSAALSVALVRARASLEGRELDFDEVHAQAFELERIFHGNPSGMDHAVAAKGGAVFYQKDAAPRTLHMRPVEAVVLDSGMTGNTSEMVAAVSALRPGIDPLLNRMGDLADQAAKTLNDTDSLGEAMTECHTLLQQIGVSNEALDALVTLARQHGAVGAKLSGAGGGGVVVALTPNGSASLLQSARERGIEAFPCSLPKN
ncbi:MAG: mevalonate kinase [Myxococcota bacterium]|nr:mevalonate kinase [Myxococcota bacterium]